MESLLVVSIINILKEAFKIFTKNKKIFAFIALFTLSLNSIQYFTNFYSIKPFITDIIIHANELHNSNSQNPQTLTQIKEDFKIFIGLELIYFVINTVVYLITTTATILAAAFIYGEKANNLSFKTLFSRTTKSWLRPLVTWLLIFVFSLVYLFVFVFILSITSLILTNTRHLIGFAILLSLCAITFYIYLSVKWNLAIVISAIEKTRGLEAIGKAGEIIKGMKLKGFVINLLLSVFAVVLSFGVHMISVKSSGVVLTKGVTTVYLSSLGNMYHFAVFTVIYYTCKKNHGERVDLEESASSGYSLVSTKFMAPTVDDQLP